MGEAIQSFLQGPWAITNDGMDNVLSMAAQSEGLLSKKGSGKPGSLTQVRDGVAIISAIGPIFHYPNFLTALFNLPSSQAISREYAAALENPEISKVILWIDSPGGQLGGISELADQIAKGKSRKRTIAYVGDYGASAAYWIASATSQIVANDTAQVGSIGVVLGLRRQHDQSIEIVSSQSPKKRPDPDTDEGRRQLQKRADALGEVFVNSVAKHRGLSKDQVTKLQGDLAIASRAKSLGLLDRITTLEDVIKDVKPTSFQGANTMTQTNLTAGQGGTVQGEKERILALVQALEGQEAYQRVKAAVDSGMTADQVKKEGGLTEEAKRRARSEEGMAAYAERQYGKGGPVGDAKQRRQAAQGMSDYARAKYEDEETNQ